MVVAAVGSSAPTFIFKNTHSPGCKGRVKTQRKTGCPAENVLAKNTATSPRGAHEQEDGDSRCQGMGKLGLPGFTSPPPWTPFLHYFNHLTVEQAVLFYIVTMYNCPHPTSQHEREADFEQILSVSLCTDTQLLPCPGGLAVPPLAVPAVPTAFAACLRPSSVH